MGRALALLALLLLACGDSETGRATGERAARLDPLPYRGEIEAVEAALYAAPPEPAGDAQQVSAALAALLASIEQREGIPGALHPARTLWAFSESVAVAPDPAAAPRDHALVQGEWEAARDRAFEPTEWFTTASIEYVESIAAQRRRLDRASVIRLTALLSGLEALADAGERECETLAFAKPQQCPSCKSNSVFAVDLLNELVELAALSSAEAEFVAPIAGLSAEGDVAALLRY